MYNMKTPCEQLTLAPELKYKCTNKLEWTQEVLIFFILFGNEDNLKLNELVQDETFVKAC